MNQRALSATAICSIVLLVSVAAFPVWADSPSGEYEALFPATGDDVNVAHDPYWWVEGDYAEAVHTPDLPQVDGVILNLVLGDNLLSCDTLDMELSLNGTVIQGFSIESGETEHTEYIELATPIASSAPITAHLEVSRTVSGGCGSVSIPLDQSTLTYIHTQGSAYFPDLGDTVEVSWYPHWWSDGDHAEGVREPGLAQVNALVYNFQFENNLLSPGSGGCSSGGEATFQFLINDTPVGDFTVDYDDGDSKEVILTFDPITATNGVTYTVRMEMVGNVASSCGNVVIPLHQSTLTLLDTFTAETFPATGDTVDVVYDPYWWNAGDYVEGKRFIPQPEVNAITYTLHITNDLKAPGEGGCGAGGEVPLALSVDGTVVATTTITHDGGDVHTLIASFTPQPGPTHTLHLEETAQVAAGCGNIQVPPDVSPFRLVDSRHSKFFPTIGDEVPEGLNWNTTGSQGEGVRIPGPTEVNAAIYILRPETHPNNAFFEMYLNGVDLGRLTVRAVQSEVARTFNFSPITSTTGVYTVTLERTDGNGGDFTIPYDNSLLRLLNTLDAKFFPTLGDVVIAPGDWNGSPDFARGMRRGSGLSQVSALVYDLKVYQNTLTDTLQMRMRVQSPGASREVTFTIPAGDPSGPAYSAHIVRRFSPITSTSGIYTITMDTLNSVGGAAVIPLDRSRLALVDPLHATTFPASGDIIHQGSDPNWDQVGDRAEGQRDLPLTAVNHLDYTLHLLHNTLTCDDLIVTLNINSTPVHTFTLVGGVMTYPVAVDFNPITGTLIGSEYRYTIILEAQNNVGTGCGDVVVPEDVSPFSLSYVATPTAGFQGSPLSGYVPLTVTFTATSTGIVGPTYSWDFGDGSTGSGQSVEHTYTATGTFPVTLTVSGFGGPVTVTRAAYITVNPLVSPTADFTADPTSGAAPLLVVFTPTVSGPVESYWWDFGDGMTSTAEAPSHIYTAAGVYTVSLTVDGPGGSATATKASYISVSTPAPPAADFTASPTSGTAPLTVTFTSIVTGGITAYAWDFGDGSTSAAANPVHVYATAGSYTVVFTATNASGSTRVEKVDYIIVNPPPAPQVDFTASPTTGVAPLAVSFTGIVSGEATAYAWDFGDGGTSSSLNPIHTYAVPGSYTVLFTATGPGGSGSISKAGYISVTPASGVSAPQVITFTAAPLSGTLPLTVSFTPTVSGTVTLYLWDFGDGEHSNKMAPIHTYEAAGVYTVTLMAGNAGGSDSISRPGYIRVWYSLYLPVVLKDFSIP